jgi:pantoate--beta-alanine ligase
VPIVKGHYQGVTQIVKKLFDAVSPDLAFFGQKDFQQVLMIQNMVKYFNIPIEIVTCPIIREDDGLAMSSRNIHLSADDREHALVLSKALTLVKNHFEVKSIAELETEARELISNTPGVQLDYFSIVNGTTLEPEQDKHAENLVALVAAKVGETRLIDNVLLND